MWSEPRGFRTGDRLAGVGRAGTSPPNGEQGLRLWGHKDGAEVKFQRGGWTRHVQAGPEIPGGGRAANWVWGSGRCE